MTKYHVQVSNQPGKWGTIGELETLAKAELFACETRLQIEKSPDLRGALVRVVPRDTSSFTGRRNPVTGPYSKIIRSIEGCVKAVQGKQKGKKKPSNPYGVCVAAMQKKYGKKKVAAAMKRMHAAGRRNPQGTDPIRGGATHITFRNGRTEWRYRAYKVRVYGRSGQKSWIQVDHMKASGPGWVHVAQATGPGKVYSMRGHAWEIVPVKRVVARFASGLR